MEHLYAYTPLLYHLKISGTVIFIQANITFGVLTTGSWATPINPCNFSWDPVIERIGVPDHSGNRLVNTSIWALYSLFLHRKNQFQTINTSIMCFVYTGSLSSQLVFKKISIECSYFNSFIRLFR